MKKILVVHGRDWGTSNKEKKALFFQHLWSRLTRVLTHLLKARIFLHILLEVLRGTLYNNTERQKKRNTCISRRNQRLRRFSANESIS